MTLSTSQNIAALMVIGTICACYLISAWKEKP